MANRKAPEQAVTDKHVALLEKATAKRAKSYEDFTKADAEFRDAIRSACKAGLLAAPMVAATGLSDTRIYQIRDSRRVSTKH